MTSLVRTISLALAVALASVSPAKALSNGEDATGSPLVVGLIRDNEMNQTSCSGALVAPRIVLTAGHCIYRYRSYLPQVSSGVLVPRTPFWVSEPGATVRYSKRKKLTRVIAQFRDPRFVESSGEPGNSHGPLYDFAVLVLESPIGSTTFDIATEADLRELQASGGPLLATGYGLKNPVDGTRSTDPRPTQTAASLRAENIKQNNLTQVISERHPGMVLQTHLPANVYMGNGDSGSPLWWKRGETWVYVGALCCALGRTASTRETDPIATNSFWATNSGGEYYAAAFFGDVIAAAMNFVAANPVAKETASPAKNRTKSLTCKRGASTRIVRGTQPKCPQGFKVVR